MPGPPARTNRGSGCLWRLMAGTRATRTRMDRPPGSAGFSGTLRSPHSARTMATFEGSSSLQAVRASSDPPVGPRASACLSNAGTRVSGAAPPSAALPAARPKHNTPITSNNETVRKFTQCGPWPCSYFVAPYNTRLPRYFIGAALAAEPRLAAPVVMGFRNSMRFAQSFDVIVIGGGHAGTEAALAAARMGARTLLLTQSIETLGQMSCNPAIGGIGKGHLVREIDALGGAMARATDRAGIQFRTLNASKGPAVRATRAQADRQLYKQAIRTVLENQPNLTLFQQEAGDLLVDGQTVRGVVTVTGITFEAPSIVLTVGTFLGGRIHVGLDNYQGGRAGDPPSNRLAARLRELPLRVGRLKTGTPPRIDGRSLDFSVMDAQPGDSPTPVFSFLGRDSEHPRQLNCFITNTNERTHEIIRAATDRSPMFTGVIEGVGPRYCPSVEDKVVRFADKVSHQIFVEPEGLTTNEVYPNGISTSLPFDVQYEFVRTIRGFENAHLTRPGYAIEYDYFDPRDLKPSLETRVIEGLFFAGQINGTTGYEEAAAQGLLG